MKSRSSSSANKRRLFLAQLKTVEFLGFKWIKIKKKQEKKSLEEQHARLSHKMAEPQNGDILGERHYALALFLPSEGETLT